MKFEILAPAGSMESLVAGVRSGANAVYLGGKLFNARRNAGNFNDNELKEAIEYCHRRSVRVYMTLNILMSDGELEEAYKCVKTALEYGIDAFIVQDLGVAKMIHDHFPTARLHASTQMSIMTPEGIKAAKELGFRRVVLPREMSLDEIKEMAESTDLELEMFVHGALCMSVSGQCYMSSVLGSRSGNRGLCAQPCRLPFTAGGDMTHALSLKDLSVISELSSLEGITSLKIEGRMKRPEYVCAAVTAVKNAVDGNFSENDERLLRSIFSRSGFTKGYLENRLGRDMFGTRQKDDVVSAAGVLKELSRRYDNEVPLLPVSMKLICKNGEKTILTVKSDRRTVTVEGDEPETAINKPMTAESLTARLSKLGGTQYYADGVEIELDDGLILPASKINELRRTAVERLDETEPPTVEAKPFTPLVSGVKSASPYLTASFRSAKQIPDVHPFERVFIPVNSSLDDFIDNRAGAVLPRGLFGSEKRLAKRLSELKRAGVKKALCGNIGSYELAKSLGFEAYGDFGLNVFNSLSARMINSTVLSFELTVEQANKINADDTGIIVYGRLPLMLTRNCPVKNDIGCAECSKRGSLTDRKGVNFPVICSDYPCVEILNSYPIYMLDRLDEVKTDFAQLYFSTESIGEVERIIKLINSGEKPDFKYTRGLYYRGAL